MPSKTTPDAARPPVQVVGMSEAPASGPGSTMHPTTIGVVHRSPVMREALRGLLAQQSGMQALASFASAQDVLKAPLEGDHVLVYDLGTARWDGRDQVAYLHRRLPQAKMVMIDVPDDDQAIVECIRAGAAGCVLQDGSLDDWLVAIRSVSEGIPYTSDRVITSVFSYVASLQGGDEPAPLPRLTRREEQILQLLGEGLTNKEIAGRLSLEHQTVKNYVHNILQKLDVRTRFEAIRSARPSKRS